MYMLSDEDSPDSDSGVRFKTESTRNRSENSFQKRQEKDKYGSKKSYGSRESDKKYSSRDRYRKSRSKSKERHRPKSLENRNHYRGHHRSRSREDRRQISNSSDHKREYRSKEHSRTHQNEIKQSKNRLEEEISKVSRKTRRDSSSEDEKKNSMSSDERFSPILPKSTKKTPKEASTVSSRSSKIIEDSPKSEVRISETFGPKNKNSEQVDSSLSCGGSESENYGPVPPKNIKNSIEVSKNVYGPLVPDSAKKSASNEDQDCVYGPILPSSAKGGPSSVSEENGKSVYGPVLPSNISKKVETETTNFGPALPPNYNKQPSESPKSILGPSLPPNFLQNSEDMFNACENAETQQSFEEVEGSESEDDMIGPLPEGHSSKNISHKLLEERALELRINALNPVDEAPRREEWMTALPDVHRANLGLGARQFRAKEGPDMSDRSSWTDTPLEKAKKLSKGKTKEVDIKEKSKLEYINKRDKEQEEIVKKHKKKKKRDKSLVEMHQEKLNKKKKEESNLAKERRPFDRDVDLKVNRFDEAQKKAVLKKAQLLDSRFSAGESKFL